MKNNPPKYIQYLRDKCARKMCSEQAICRIPIKDRKSNSKSALPTNQLTHIRPHLRDESAAVISLHEIDVIRCFKFSKNSISAISTIMSDNCEVKSFVESKDHEGIKHIR